jgi:hypothetical protein
VKRPCLLLVLCLIAFTPAEAPSCGPFFQFAFFDPPSRPAVAAGDMLNGKFGVIRGSHWLEFLIPAWRYLDGKPIRLNSRPASEDRSTGDWNDWQRARTQISATPVKPIDGFDKVPGDDYASYLDCPQSAFGHAARTLNERIREFGGDHAGVRAWLRAQDLVFANCEGGTSLPDSPEPGLPALLAADRRYQIAAAHFYAGRFDDAREAFLEIGRDAASPWRSSAPYLAARCLIRKGTIRFDQAVLEKAENELRTLATTSSDSEVRRWAAELIGFVVARIRPGDALAELATALTDPTQDESYLENRWDFDLLWTRSGGTGEWAGKNELLDWLLAMRNRLGRDAAYNIWTRRKNAPWLVAALNSAEPYDANVTVLLEAAAKVSPDSPAYATAAFHRVRLSPNQTVGDRRALLDETLEHLRRRLSPAALNPFLRERFAIAADFEELLRFAPRTPAAVGADFGIPDDPQDKTQSLFDDDATRLFNGSIPLSGWLIAASSQLLNQGLRDRIIRAGWVRAHLVGDKQAETAFGKMLRASTPQIASLFDPYTRAHSPDAKRFAAVFLMLKTPGMRPFLRTGLDRDTAFSRLSDFRDNWWCSSDDTWWGRQQLEKPPVVALPPAISKDDAAAAVEEVQRIEADGPAAAYFGRVASAWAREHSGDPRSPEALHLSVRAARYPCQGTNSASKEAFQTLHRLYPKSEWAKKTPYWY